MLKKLFTAGVLSVGLLGASSSAFAQSKAVEKPISIGGLLGFGFRFESGNPYSFGFGARGGYTLPFKLYVGGRLGYHIGSSVEAPGLKISTSAFFMTGEVGYDLNVGPVIIRPYAGIGFLMTLAKSEASGTDPFTGAPIESSSQSSSKGHFLMTPGATLIYPIGPAFVGADTHFFIGPEGGFGMAIHGTGGVRF